MQIHHNYSLKKYNTFGIDAKCRRLIILESEDDIVDYFENNKKGSQFLLLGGGSNLLIKNDLDYDVLKPNLLGIEIVNEDTTSITLEVMAGQNWHKFVEYSVMNNYYGFENLALIPGNVGTAPIQNIGAYGVEQEQHFISLRGFNIESKQFETYSKEQCKFGYRNSIFKSKLKSKFIITSVQYKLCKTDNPNLSYAELENYLTQRKLEVSAKNVFEAVIDIRSNKLPSPSKLGNSGSFFKNPIITQTEFDRISDEYSDLRGFPQNDGTIKISAGWLIEKAGLKGYRLGDAAVYDKHALILVNYGDAIGDEIWGIAEHVITTVLDKFQVRLEPEVNVVE
ncbi:MAG: UDP-N-acetylmuramate dehydrogenase [Candidatus Kapaibacterium sp.]